MLSIWRPPSFLKDENGYPYEENQTVIAIQKSKPKGIGSNGLVNLFYDVKKHCYYEYNNGRQKYASRKVDNEEVKEEKETETIYEVPNLVTNDIFNSQNTLENFEDDEYGLIDEKDCPF